MRGIVSFLSLLIRTGDTDRAKVGDEEALQSLTAKWVSCPLSYPYSPKA